VWFETQPSLYFEFLFLCQTCYCNSCSSLAPLIHLPFSHEPGETSARARSCAVLVCSCSWSHVKGKRERSFFLTSVTRERSSRSYSILSSTFEFHLLFWNEREIIFPGKAAWDPRQKWEERKKSLISIYYFYCPPPDKRKEIFTVWSSLIQWVTCLVHSWWPTRQSWTNYFSTKRNRNQVQQKSSS